MKQHKKIISFLISLTLVFSICILPTSAGYAVQHGDAAKALWEDGLFLGSGSSFDLDQPLTRPAGAAMIVRLLGREAEAKSKSYTIPFTDVPEWAVPYVGYCYENSIVNGTGATTFGSNDNMSATQYLTLVLRALGYNDKAGDFSWDKAPAKALEVGLIDNASYTQYVTAGKFLRDDVVFISYNALSQYLKGTSTTLKSSITIPGRPKGEMPAYTSADASATNSSASSASDANTDASASPAVLADAGTAPAEDSRTYLNLVIDGKTVEVAHKPFSCSLGGFTVFIPITEFLDYLDVPYQFANGGKTITYTLNSYTVSSTAGVDKVTYTGGYAWKDGIAPFIENGCFYVPGNHVDKDIFNCSWIVKSGGSLTFAFGVKDVNQSNSPGSAETPAKTVDAAALGLSIGRAGSNVTCIYKYASGKPYAVSYYFMLSTGSYSGSYTMSFPSDDGTDTQTFTVESNSVYQITYTYALNYTASANYKYTLTFSLSGSNGTANITSTDTHPGKLRTGSFNIAKAS